MKSLFLTIIAIIVVFSTTTANAQNTTSIPVQRLLVKNVATGPEYIASNFKITTLVRDTVNEEDVQYNETQTAIVKVNRVAKVGNQWHAFPNGYASPLFAIFKSQVNNELIVAQYTSKGWSNIGTINAPLHSRTVTTALNRNGTIADTQFMQAKNNVAVKTNSQLIATL